MAVRRTAPVPPEGQLKPGLTRRSAWGPLSRRALLHAAFALAPFATSLTMTRSAHAELTLRWDAPAACPQREEVLSRIQALVGPTLEDTQGLSAEGRIAPVKGRFYLRLLVRDGTDVKERVIASASCSDLAGAAAVTLVLLLGIPLGSAREDADTGTPPTAAPGAGASGREPSAGGREGRPAGRDEPGDAGEELATARAARGTPRPWAILLRVPIATVDSGPLPRPSVGLGIGAGMRYEAWRFLVSGGVSRRQTVSALELGTVYGAELSRWTGRLEVCRGWRAHWFEIAPCVGMALEHVTARGTGANISARARRALWPAPGAGLAAHWYAQEWMAFFAGLSGYLELSRPRLVIDGVGEVGRLAPAAVGGLVGVEWIF